MDIVSKNYVDEEGFNVYETTYVIFSVRMKDGGFFHTRKEDDAQRVAGSGRASGSGIYSKEVQITQNKNKTNKHITMTTKTVEDFSVENFDEAGKQQHELYLEKQNCKHDRGTYQKSWGAGCSYDVQTYCSFCKNPV